MRMVRRPRNTMRLTMAMWLPLIFVLETYPGRRARLPRFSEIKDSGNGAPTPKNKSHAWRYWQH